MKKERLELLVNLDYLERLVVMVPQVILATMATAANKVYLVNQAQKAV